MQPVNDDMDNLFRRAAADYPLQTHPPGFDFEQVRQQLAAAPAPAGKRQRRWMWLLWLVLIGFVVEHHFYSVPNRTTKAGHPAAAVVAQQPVADAAADTAQPVKTVTQPTVQRQEPGKAASENPVAVNRTDRKAPEDHPTVALKSPAKTRSPGYMETSASRRQRRKTHVPEQTLQAGTVSGNKPSKAVGPIGHPSTGTSKEKILAGSREQLPAGASGDSSRQNGVVQKTADPAADTTAHTGVLPADTTETGRKEIRKKDSTAAILARNRKKRAKTTVAKQGFYIGLLAGTDWSRVKSSRTSSAGYNAGLLAGYGVGKHWVVQVGFLWNLKRYYADGRYVAVEKLNLRPHTEVIYIDGTCGMMELPLNIQYHFAYKRRHHWYAVAGVSSYLMKEENYYYAYRRYNQSYYGETTYRNASQNWFSVVQAGAGYQLATGKKGSIRIEPYVKLPVARIGIAGLPLSSAGVNVGYVLSLQ